MVLSIERQIRDLEAFDSRGAPVLSLYLPAADGRLREEIVQDAMKLFNRLASELSPEQRADLDMERESVRDYLGSMVAPPLGVALFSCSRRRYFRVVRLPVPVPRAVFWSPDAATRPLREAADRAWGALLESGLVPSP
jgi:hypothetical protein